MNIDRLIKKSHDSKQIVSKYYDGELVVKNNLDPIQFNKVIDWEYEHYLNKNTYQIYLHSLNILKSFVNQYIITSNRKYIKEAKKIITNWYTHNLEINNNNNFSWNEHAASYRIINIIYFQQNAKDFKLRSDIFDKIIISHVQFLNDEKNYKENNHGVMMDNSLLVASHFLKDNEYKNLISEKVYYRIQSCIFRDFSRKGIHLENSPEYHRLILNLFRDTRIILEEINRPFSNEVIELLELAKEFNAIMIKPNKTYPLIGDTGYINDKNIVKKFNDFVDYESGIAVFQKQNKQNKQNSTWFYFKAGYQKTTHKHYDDLSFNLYIDGNDIFIDSGKYSYDKNSAERKYLISPTAHNTLLLDSRNYKLQNPIKQQKKVSINKNNIKNQYKLVSGKNNLYHSTYVSRNCILTNDDALIIYDVAASKVQQSYIQNFILNPKILIKKCTEKKVELVLGNNKYILETLQINKNENIEFEVKESYISHEFGKLINNKRIEFSKKGNNTRFLTIFYRKDEKKFIEDVHIHKGKLIYWNNKSKVIVDL